MTAPSEANAEPFAHPDFREVHELLVKSTTGDHRYGAAVCVLHRGETVVDAWAGRRSPEGEVWQADTMALSFSTSKGICSTAIHMLADRGELGYDDPVSRFWPEFAQSGKQHIRVSDVLTHRAGMHRSIDIARDPEELLDWDRVTNALASSACDQHAVNRPAYHALTYGFLTGEIVRRITGMTIGTFIRREIADPLALDGLYIGTPLVERHRIAPLMPVGKADAAASAERMSKRMRKIRFTRFAAEALHSPGWEALFRDPSLRALDGEIPAVNGTYTARSLARVYGMVACGGALDGIRLLSESRTRAMAEVQTNQRDLVTKLRMRWRLGYHQPFGAKGAQNTLGSYGFGGSGGMADLGLGLAVGFVTNDMRGGSTPFADLRIVRIVRAARAAAMARDRTVASHE